jgi:hypothetical protein
MDERLPRRCTVHGRAGSVTARAAATGTYADSIPPAGGFTGTAEETLDIEASKKERRGPRFLVEHPGLPRSR